MDGDKSYPLDYRLTTMEPSIHAVYVGAGRSPETVSQVDDEDGRIDFDTASQDEVAELVERGDVDCVVSDHEPPEVDALELLEEVREVAARLPFVLYVSDGSEELAAEALSFDATDYLIPADSSAEELAEAVAEGVEEFRRIERLESREADLRKYRNMVHSMQESACIYDEDGRFDTVNEHLADWFDTTREELEGEESSLIPLVKDRKGGDVFQELLEGEREEVTGEVESDFPSHGHAVLEYRLTPLEVDGDVEGVVGVTRDITEVTLREREVRETRDRLDLALESTNTGIWEWDLKTNEVVWDETLERSLGLEPGSFEGTLQAFVQRVHPDDREKIWDKLQEAIQEDELYEAEFRIRHEDGSMRWSASRGKLVERDGDGRRMIGVYQDITERKQHEQLLEQQNRRLEEFASVVSHDLRNPLHVAKGRLELARDECSTEHHDDIEGALDRMQRILEDVLWLAREGRDIGSMEPIDLEAEVERCWRVDVDDSEEADLVVGEDLQDSLEADRDRLRQMLQNLLKNAVEHGGEDVTVEVGGHDDGFYVEDDGPGVPEEVREEIFEVGYSTSDEGTGFGLRIVERVAEAHGWDVEVADGPEGGARFEVTDVDQVGGGNG